MIDWLNVDPGKYSSNIELAYKFLMSSVKKGGSYGSTQATVLSLQALVLYSQKFGGLKGSGSFKLTINGDSDS